MGPLATLKQRDRYEGMLAQARQQGAKVDNRRRPAGRPQPRLVRRTHGADRCDARHGHHQRGAVRPGGADLPREGFRRGARRSPTARAMASAPISIRSTWTRAFRAVNEIEIRHPLGQRAACSTMTRCPSAAASSPAPAVNWGRKGCSQFQNTKFVMIDPKASNQDFWWYPYKKEEAFAGS